MAIDHSALFGVMRWRRIAAILIRGGHVGRATSYTEGGQ